MILYGASQVHSPVPFATVFVPRLSLNYYLICENLLSSQYAILAAIGSVIVPVLILDGSVRFADLSC